MTNYLYNGVKLPAPPLGFTGNMLLLNDAETGQYIMCYGTFYRYPFDSMPICSPSASLPTCYAIKAGMTKWTEISITPDGGSGAWTLVAASNEYIWTNNDIYWLDSETASNPTSSVAYQGTIAEIVPELPVVPDEPGVSISVGHKAMTQGWLIGRRLAAMRKIVQVLPDGYTRLEYIESDGKNSINTGITNWNQTIEYEIMLGVRQQTGGTTTFWGCFDSWTTSGNNSPAISTYTSYRVPTNFIAGYAATAGTDIGIANGQTGIFALKGDTISWSEGTSVPFDRSKTFTNAMPFHLFSTYYSGRPQEHAKYPLYYAKFWLNGDLIRDFVPCTNPDGEQGLWDKVEQKFYGFY